MKLENRAEMCFRQEGGQKKMSENLTRAAEV